MQDAINHPKPIDVLYRKRGGEASPQSAVFSVKELYFLPNFDCLCSRLQEHGLVRHQEEPCSIE
jgi:hypothetical protein